MTRINIVVFIIFLTLNSAGQVTLPSYQGAHYAANPCVYDCNADAFIAATGITDGTQKTAINQLVLDLKSAGVWTKGIALYPNVGGTSTTHSYNLFNPALHQATFTGSPTHSSLGVVTNGSSQYADMNVLRADLTSQSSWVFYGTFSVGKYLGGCYGSTDRANYIFITAANKIQYNNPNELVANTSASADASATGFKGATRISPDQTYFLGNTIAEQITTTTVAAMASASFSLVYGALRNQAGGGITDYTAGTYKTVGMFNGLSGTELQAIKTAIVNFNTTLGR
jgi:hypothetical protein